MGSTVAASPANAAVRVTAFAHLRRMKLTERESLSWFPSATSSFAAGWVPLHALPCPRITTTTTATHIFTSLRVPTGAAPHSRFGPWARGVCGNNAALGSPFLPVVRVGTLRHRVRQPDGQAEDGRAEKWDTHTRKGWERRARQGEPLHLSFNPQPFPAQSCCPPPSRSSRRLAETTK